MWRALWPLHKHTTDTTKAGIEQTIGGHAMPSTIDEASDQRDQRGAQVLMDLLLSASAGDGARVLRGTSAGRARSVEVLGV